MRRERLIPFVIILCVGLFFILTLRQGHQWGDDFAMYLLHTRNLAEGLPYSTGYFYNPAEPHMGPPAYPPLFPLVLLPFYKLAGLNYTALKAAVILTFLVFLWAMYLVSSRYLTWGWRIVFLILIGFQPYLWNMRNDIVSDIPFLMFLYLALALGEHFSDLGDKRKPPLWTAVLLGVVLSLPYCTRNVGLAIIPAFLLYDVLKRRRVTLFACIAAATAVLLAVLEGKVMKTTGGYAGLFHLTPGWMVHNSILYVKAARVFLVNGFSNLFSYGVFAIALLLTGWGALVQLRRGVHLLELFALVYLPLIAAFSVPGLQRYLLPVLPLFFIYILTGLQSAMDALPALRKPIAAAALVLIFLTYAGAYAKSERGPFHEGVNDPYFLEACRYLREHGSPSDIVIFRKPRVLALLTGLQGAVYDTTGTPEVIRGFVHQIHARYIMLAAVPHEDFEADTHNLLPAVERYQGALTEVFANPHFRIFALKPDF
jgi:hypothetical protein